MRYDRACVIVQKTGSAAGMCGLLRGRQRENMADHKQTDRGRTGRIQPRELPEDMRQPRLKTRPDTPARTGRLQAPGDAEGGQSSAGTGKGRARNTSRTGSGRGKASGTQQKTRGRSTAGSRDPGTLTAEERKARMREYRVRKEQYRRKKLQKKIMRRALLVLAVVGLFLVLTGVIALVRRANAEKARREAEAAAAEEIARTQMQVDASEVMHLSFPVLTLDKEEETTEESFVDEDGDGIPDELGDDLTGGTEENGEMTEPLMLDTDGDGIPDTEAVVDTDGDGVPDAPEGAVAYEDTDTLTVQDFNRILNELYEQDYVLVDIYSLASEGEAGFTKNQISVPVGKKPLIISERDVSYSTQSDGHADRLIIDEGAIATEYMNEDGESVIGEQDVVPALEAFIRQHPDFSFQGARGIVGVTGYRGLFGYQVVLDEAVITTPAPDILDSADKTIHGGDSRGAAGTETGENDSGQASGEPEERTDTPAEDQTEAQTGGEAAEESGEQAAEGTGGQSAEDTGEQTAEEAGEQTDGEAGETTAQPTAEGSGDSQRSYIGNDAVKANVADVEQIINMLRGTGWRIASNGYSLLSYGSEFSMMKEDMDIWQEDIGSILGTTDILLYPRKTDIASWSIYPEDNEKFSYLRNAGFKYFCIEDNRQRSWLQVQPSYVRQGIHEISNYRDFEEIMQLS